MALPPARHPAIALILVAVLTAILAWVVLTVTADTREAERQADGFNSRDHAITAWAFASAAHAAPSLFDAIAARAGAAPLLGQCSEQSLSNLAWAFATAGHEAPELLDAIARAARQRLSEFTPQGAVTASSA